MLPQLNLINLIGFICIDWPILFRLTTKKYSVFDCDINRIKEGKSVKFLPGLQLSYKVTKPDIAVRLSGRGL